EPDDARRYTAVRTKRHADGETETGPGGARRLVFVVSGAVDVVAADMRARLRPGDVLLIDDHSSSGHGLEFTGDCRLIEVDVADTWSADGIVPPAVDDGQRDAAEPPTVKRMVVRDDQAEFRDF